MSSEKNERDILLLSFGAGVLFAVTEFIFSIYSHSQSALMDAAYDASELIIIILTLFLVPLFHKPISEKRPYGFFQVESIFMIIKVFMIIAVTVSLSANVIGTALSGGNPVDGGQISLFEFGLAMASVLVLFIMKRMNKSLSSPTVTAEILDWKLDVAYSLGMSAAFFISTFLDGTPLAFISPYVDPLVAVIIVVLMLPENIKLLWTSMKDLFLFSPDEETVAEIKRICHRTLDANQFQPTFFDITRTGRHLWVAIYFEILDDCLYIEKLNTATQTVNEELAKHFENCTCELILTPRTPSMNT